MALINAFIDVFLDMSLYMLIGMVLTGVLSVVMKKQTVAKHLGHGSRFAGFKAAALGVPLPLCSCGVLPTTVYLSQSGASTSAVMAFLISTPQTGVDSIIATFGMMGLVFAVYRPVAAFISGVAGGAIIQKLTGNRKFEDVSENSGNEESCGCGCGCACSGEPIKQKETLRDKLTKMTDYAFVEFVDDISVHFLIGVLIAAVITVVIPLGFFKSLNISSGILAMLIMLVIGLPMYICSTSSIPIALVLLAKGISPGAAFVFLFAGPATNAASLSVLSKTLGKKTVAVYLAVTAISAVGFGLLLDGIINWWSLPMPEYAVQTAANSGNVIKIVSGVIFGALIVRSIGSKLLRRFKTGKDKCKKEEV